MDFEKIYNDSVSNIFILPWHIAIICKRKTEKKKTDKAYLWQVLNTFNTEFEEQK
jgi:hypothetical protein